MDTFRGMKRDLGAHAQTPNKVTSPVHVVAHGKCPGVYRNLKNGLIERTIHPFVSFQASILFSDHLKDDHQIQ